MSLFKRKQKSHSDILITYGTETGNSKLIAQQARKYYISMGLSPICKNMAELSPEALLHYKNILLIISTHGEGEPPYPAEKFYDDLHHPDMCKLTGLRYSVCALGDSSYMLFCETGRKIDKRFEQLGATPFHSRVDCDLYFSEAAIQWIKDTARVLIESSVAARQN